MPDSLYNGLARLLASAIDEGTAPNHELFDTLLPVPCLDILGKHIQALSMLPRAK